MDAVTTVWRFPTATGARDAVDLLADGRCPVLDAVVLTWRRDRRGPVVRRPGRIVGDAVLAGAFWGLVVGLPLLAPITGAAVGAAIGLLVVGFTRPAVDNRVVRAHRHEVTPGTSVLLLLSDPLDGHPVTLLWTAGGALVGAPVGRVHR